MVHSRHLRVASTAFSATGGPRCAKLAVAFSESSEIFVAGGATSMREREIAGLRRE